MDKPTTEDAAVVRRFLEWAERERDVELYRERLDGPSGAYSESKLVYERANPETVIAAWQILA
jgi:hypothetical protein